jgi:hypothetical protein
LAVLYAGLAIAGLPVRVPVSWGGGVGSRSLHRLLQPAMQ